MKRSMPTGLPRTIVDELDPGELHQHRFVDEEMYKWRHLIENFFGRLKEFKRIAMRADKTDQRFASMIPPGGSGENSR